MSVASDFLAPFLKDKALWASLVTSALGWVCKKLGVEIAGDALMAVGAGVAGYLVTHVGNAGVQAGVQKIKDSTAPDSAQKE